jgi:hypothetical protein
LVREVRAAVDAADPADAAHREQRGERNVLEGMHSAGGDGEGIARERQHE